MVRGGTTLNAPQAGNPQTSAQSTVKIGRGIPVVNMVINASGPQAMFAVKIDSRMTLEQLKETTWSLYAHHCRDEGIAFQPPSPNYHDYDVTPCFPDGRVNAQFEQWVDARAGGGTVRDQLASVAPPVFCVMSIGLLWLQRDTVLAEEHELRERVYVQRDNMMESLCYFADVSVEAKREEQVFRERQERMVKRLEEVLVGGYVAFSQHERRIAREAALLEDKKHEWVRHEQALSGLFEDYSKKKRVWHQSSVAKVSVDAKIGTVECAVPL